ncbi:anti-sigma B factor RsbW [Oceanobacillus luteolus]|uniref:Serine-protein kinase RsbW n=1 Tax=Oceanobacillus luteolus TaxID=1274358 RepID=A0ABW4HVM2_9BACI|nr:anti-sigma B factor RsbW [Oceanobacillus luteolus]MCM3742269.1 anti-sigma B factor RsbW [Oceanobacillus luteolus]
MEKFDFIEMTIPSKADYIGVVRLSLSGIANRIGFSFEDIEDLKVAVSEAITNAVTHAYDEEDKGEITIGFGVYDDRLEVMVADSGVSFNVDEVRRRVGPYEKSKPLEDIQEGGFGLFLIDALMDEVEIHDNSGIIIIMTKFINETGVDLDGDQISTTS